MRSAQSLPHLALGLVTLVFVGCVDVPTAPDTPSSETLRFDAFKGDAPALATEVVPTVLGDIDGDGPVVELIVTDVWGRLPDRESVVTIAHEHGHKVELAGYLEPLLVRLDRPGRYTLHAQVPDHLPESMHFEVTANGDIPVPADQVTHWAFGKALRAVDGRDTGIYGLYIGLEHRFYAASGPPPRRGNSIELYHDGASAFGALADDLDGARERVHLSFWLMKALFELRRSDDLSLSADARRANTIIETLRRLPGVKRVLLNEFWGRSDTLNDVGVLDDEIQKHAEDAGDDIEVVLQANETEVPYYDTIPVTDGEWSYVERLLAVYPEWADRAFLNEETITPSVYDRELKWTDLQVGSWHQKFVTVDGRVGFLGGMNMNWADWDRADHDVHDPLRAPFALSAADRRDIAALKEPAPINPRKDYMARIEGPLVDDVEALFQKRWDLAIMRNHHYAQNVTPFDRDPPLDLRGDVPGVEAQLTVTTPMPFWEHSILESMRRAIESAEDFIYIEDQYFRMPILNTVIERRMREVPDLKLIVITKPVGYWDPGRKWTALANTQFVKTFPDRYLLLTLTAHALVNDGRGNVEARFAPVDIHSKMLIVDDRLMSVGSCNKNNRGLIYEGEANLMIHDPDFVRSERQRIYARLVGERLWDRVVDAEEAFDVFTQLALRNQQVQMWWDDEDFEVPASRVTPERLPEGLVFPLEVPDSWWFDVGPDFS